MRNTQDGGNFTQHLIRLATPLLREGVRSMEQGQSWQQAGKNVLASFGRGVKRKPQTALYKKVPKRARDIFGE